MSQNSGYNFREDKDGEYFLYYILGILFLGVFGYQSYKYLSPYWASVEDEVKETKVVLGGVLNDSGEYVNVFGDAIGSFYSWKLPNGKSISIPTGGLEESFLKSLEDETSYGTTYIFDRLYFQTGSASISETSDDQVNSIVEILRAYPELKVLLRGHTDNTGNSELNAKLSENRAQNLKTKLLNASIDSSRVLVEGLGPVEPVETNDTAAGRSRNRRVDISVVR